MAKKKQLLITSIDFLHPGQSTSGKKERKAKKEGAKKNPFLLIGLGAIAIIALLVTQLLLPMQTKIRQFSDQEQQLNQQLGQIGTQIRNLEQSVKLPLEITTLKQHADSRYPIAEYFVSIMNKMPSEMYLKDFVFDAQTASVTIKGDIILEDSQNVHKSVIRFLQNLKAAHFRDLKLESLERGPEKSQFIIRIGL